MTTLYQETKPMNTANGNIALTTEQKEIVKSWYEASYPIPTPSAEDKQPLYSGMFDPKKTGALINPDFEIFITETGLYFNMILNDDVFKEDTLFGLSKDVFAKVIKTQSFHQERGFYTGKPKDENNCIIHDENFGTFYSSINKHWYETDKRWKDRVYTVDLLIQRLEQAQGRTHITKLEELLNTASSGAQEHHQPINIKMVLEHLNDKDLNLQVMEILEDLVVENTARVKRFKEFKNKIRAYQLSKDFEGDKLTPNTSGIDTQRHPRIRK